MEDQQQQQPQQPVRSFRPEFPKTLARPPLEKYDETKYDDEGNLLQKEQLKLQTHYHSTVGKFQTNVGEHLMDMDGFARSMLKDMPNIPTEIMYKMALNNLSKVFVVFFVMGILMIVTVIAYSVSWGVQP